MNERLIAEVGLQDGLDFEDIVAFAAGALTMITLYTAFRALPFVKRLKAFFTWWEQFKETWDGKEATPGSDRVPGLPERVNSIDGELKRNGGSTVKDAIFKTKREVEKINRRLDYGDNVQRTMIATSEANMQALATAFEQNGLEAPKLKQMPPVIPIEIVEDTDPDRDHRH